MGWSLVVRLADTDVPTVVWQDGKKYDWSDIRRYGRTDGVDIAGDIRAAFSAPVKSFDERENSPVMAKTIDGKFGPRRIQIHHVVDTFNEACGLQIWIGDPASEVEPRTRAAGFWFDYATAQVTNSIDTWLLGSSNIEGFGRVSDPDQFLNQVIRADDVAETIELCSNPPLRETQIAKTTLLHKDGHLETVITPARSYENEVRFLSMVVTPWSPPEIDPATALRLAGATDTGQLCALVAFVSADDLPEIVYWASTPPDWLAYWSGLAAVPRGTQGVLHDHDRVPLATACGSLDAGAAESEEIQLRLRTADRGWRTVDTVITRYPSPDPNTRLYVATMTPLPSGVG